MKQSAKKIATKTGFYTPKPATGAKDEHAAKEDEIETSSNDNDVAVERRLPQATTEDTANDDSSTVALNDNVAIDHDRVQSSSEPVVTKDAPSEPIDITPKSDLAHPSSGATKEAEPARKPLEHLPIKVGRQGSGTPAVLSPDVCLMPGEVVVRVEEAPQNARRIFTVPLSIPILAI